MLNKEGKETQHKLLKSKGSTYGGQSFAGTQSGYQSFAADSEQRQHLVSSTAKKDALERKRILYG